MIRAALAVLLPAPLFVLAFPVESPAGTSQSYQGTGNLGLEVTGLAGGNFTIVNGNLVLTQMPPGASVQKAFLYVSQINSSSGFDVTFNGFSVGPTGAPASDPGFVTLYNFRHDVTNFVVPGVNTVAIGQQIQGSAIAGVGLAVVWQDPRESQRAVEIVDGMQQVGESGAETETIAFQNLPAGPTALWTFTVYDDSTATGETVRYNGATVGGPIDQFLGLNASVLSMNGTSVSGADSLSITTIADHMGWMAAAAAVDVGTVDLAPRGWGEVKALHR